MRIRIHTSTCCHTSIIPYNPEILIPYEGHRKTVSEVETYWAGRCENGLDLHTPIHHLGLTYELRIKVGRFGKGTVFVFTMI
jgi:hypothetical protein